MKRYILWRWSEFALFVVLFFGKKEERMLKQKQTYLMDCLGQLAYIKCLSNIHIDFLAND